MLSPRRLSSTALPLFLLLAVGCTGAVSDLGGSFEPEPPITVPPSFEAEPAAMARLTVAQYENSVHDILGEHILVPTELEPDTAINGSLSIGASRTTISPRGVAQYEDAAYAIAQQALDASHRNELVGCATSVARTTAFDRACAEEFTAEYGRRLFRRSLTTEEVSRYVLLAEEATMTLGDFFVGLEFTLAGLLQSPNFLFRVELGEASGSFKRYSSIEMASRLSYTLWNSTPDDALLDAAEAGELVTNEGLEAQVDRMISDDRIRVGVQAFFAQMLRLDELAQVDKEDALFTDAFREAARLETTRSIEHRIIDEAGDYRELFTSYDTFVNSELATVYGLTTLGESRGLSMVTLDESAGRRGLLGQASILALHSHEVDTSAAMRGVFVRQTLLCGTIPPPPPDVSTTFPPSSAPTLRERVANHLMNDGCASCHELMDPIGLGLENFDAIGRFRETENEAMIDPSGEVDGVSFTDAADLGRVVAEHPQLGQCLARTFYRHATGHPVARGERDALSDLTDEFNGSEYRVLELMKATMMSPGFRFAGEEG